MTARCPATARNFAGDTRGGERLLVDCFAHGQSNSRMRAWFGVLRIRSVLRLRNLAIASTLTGSLNEQYASPRIHREVGSALQGGPSHARFAGGGLDDAASSVESRTNGILCRA